MENMSNEPQKEKTDEVNIAHTTSSGDILVFLFLHVVRLEGSEF